MTYGYDTNILPCNAFNIYLGDGLPDLKAWIQQHMTELHHNPSTSAAQTTSVDTVPFGVCVSVGSTDSFSKCLSMFDGDTVLFDEYAYGSAVATSRTHGRTNVGVRMDSEGMIPADLQKQITMARDNGLNPDMGK